MLRLRQAEIINVGYRVAYMWPWSRGKYFVTASKTGAAQMFAWGPPKRIAAPLFPTRDARWVSLHPTRSQVAFVDKTGKLRVARIDGTPIFEEAPLPPRHDTPSWVTMGFSHCCFDESGRFLWYSAVLSEHEIVIQLRETKRWTVVSQCVVMDPFRGSSASFHPTGRPDVCALWLAAGQDGQQVFWIRREPSGIRCELDSNLRDTIPPAFSPTGKHFLAINDDIRGQGLRRFSFDPQEEIGACASPGGEADAFDVSLCYLDKVIALADTSKNRVYAIDTTDMRVIKEIVIEGHKPRPTSQYYGLADESLCTDLSYFQRVGDRIVFVVNTNTDAKVEDWRQRLIAFPVKTILNELEA